jgi:hypothetical protein
MIGMADLITVAVIKNKLEFLSKNPTHLEFILGAFACDPIRSYVGKEHLKQCIDFVTQNRIQVAPYYELDMKRRPSIGVVSSGREESMFLGDYGSEGHLNHFSLPPRIYAEMSSLFLLALN